MAEAKQLPLPENNREDLGYFLSLQASAFPENPRYNADGWNKRAELWEQERKQQPKSDERVEKTLDYLTRRGILTPQMAVADIGCGAGRFAAAFAQRCARVVGFDLSGRMVDYGNAHIQSLGLKNAQLYCRDFAALDIEKEGCKGAFDLVFSSLTPVIHNAGGLQKAMEMSRGWCMNISHLHRNNPLRQRLVQELFPWAHQPGDEGKAFYALFNTLFLLGYQPEVSYMTRRKESRVQPDEAYAAYMMEHALPVQAHTSENKEKILRWLEKQGNLTEVSDATFGCILWDVRQRISRPDYRK